MNDAAHEPGRRKGRYGAYREAYDHFAHLIDSGRMLPGDRLPTYEEIEKRFNISHATVTKVIRLLREARYVESTTRAVVVKYTTAQRLLAVLQDTLNDMEDQHQQVQVETDGAVSCISGRDGGVCWNPKTGLWETFTT